MSIQRLVRESAYESRELNTAQIATDERMDEKMVAYPYNGIPLRNKKAWTVNIMDKSHNNYTECKKPEKRAPSVWFHLHSSLQKMQTRIQWLKGEGTGGREEV